jgi:hypothetical protein
MKVRYFLELLLIFLVVLSGGSVLFVMYRNIGYIIIFLLSLILLYNSDIKSSILKAIVLTSISICAIFYSTYIFAIAEQSVLKYLFILLMSTGAVFVVAYFKNNYKQQRVVSLLYVVLKLFLLHGLLSFVLSFIVEDYLVSFTAGHYESDTFFHIFHYNPSHQIDLLGFKFYRNQGLFWEPGVFQVFLNIFFFLEAFIMKRSKLLLYLVSFVILTTYSTTGFFILFIQLLVLFFQNSNNRVYLIPTVLIVMLPLYMLFKVNIEEKIYGDYEMSFQIRLFDFIQPVGIALENPLTGIGLDRDKFVEYRYSYFLPINSINKIQEFSGIMMKQQGTEEGSTNSLMFLLAGAGIPTTVFFIYMLSRQQIVRSNRRLFVFIIIISIMSSPLLFRTFFFMFIVSGIMSTFYKITSNKQQLS